MCISKNDKNPKTKADEVQYTTEKCSLNMDKIRNLASYCETKGHATNKEFEDLMYKNRNSLNKNKLAANFKVNYDAEYKRLRDIALEQKILKVIATANVTSGDDYGNTKTERAKILIAYWNMDDVKKFNCQNYPDIFEKTITNPKLFKNEVIVTSDFFWKLRKECEKGARNMGICTKMVVKNPNSF